MCGIVGYLGPQDPKKIIIEGLKKLEYRGYDSAGVAVLHNGKTKRIRAEGKLKNLEDKLINEDFNGNLGIGHTRWATHGAAVEKNAHPHQVGEISIVHNGIIENYLDIKKNLLARGAKITSDTDSELVAHLINEEIQQTQNLLLAVQRTLGKLMGAFSVLVMWEKSPQEMIAFKDGPPLIVGINSKNKTKEFFVVSDIQAALNYTKDFVYLEDREVVHIADNEINYYSSLGAPLKKQVVTVDWNPEQIEKMGFKHFMLKEIYEQPRAVAAAMRPHINTETHEVNLQNIGFAKPTDEVFKSIERVIFIACGTSFYAASVAQYLLEQVGGLQVQVDIASEFRYR
ncbi:MAG: isomerizing glutamine--fructose-6-phosphate transaminase, partial [Bdellovibrionota bacterium]